MAQSLLQKFFPPPKFLKMPVTGLDISDGSVHVAELVYTLTGRKIKRIEKRPIPEGLIEKGRIKDPKKVKKFFTQLRKDLNLKYINISLPEQYGYVVMMRIPKVQPEDIYSNIELQIEEHVPMPAQQAVFGYRG